MIGGWNGRKEVEDMAESRLAGPKRLGALALLASRAKARPSTLPAGGATKAKMRR